ncbi:MAG: DUF4157 domain-containing protein [bacterium]
MAAEREAEPQTSTAAQPAAAQAPVAAPALQRESTVGQSAELSGGDALGVAAQGVAGAGQPLPHLDAIQASFGKHDVTGVQAHTGSAAEGAAAELSANAYAVGNDVAFSQSSPSLHTAAHEAAHVVQQKAGVQLEGGVGRSGDAYEQHADAVADAVVSGQSAEALLDASPGGAGGGTGVQREDPPAASTRTTATRHQVVRGDNLSRLATRYLGEARRWREIREANPGKVHTHEGRRDMIRVGEMLIIPPATAPAAATEQDEATGETPAMTAVDMLRTSVEAGDALSAAQTWSTLGAEERGQITHDPCAPFAQLLAAVTEDAAVSILATLSPENSCILQLANDRGGSATFLRAVLAQVGVSDLATLTPMAQEIAGLTAFATPDVLDPLVNGAAVTGVDQVVFATTPGGRALLEAAWGATFPLTYLRAIAADGPLARESMVSQPAFGDWLLLDPAGFSAFILAQADAIEWMRALWLAGKTDELAGMITANQAGFGPVFGAAMGALTPADVTAIKASTAGRRPARRRLALRRRPGRDGAGGAPGLSLPEAIKAVDAAGLMTPAPARPC